MKSLWNTLIYHPLLNILVALAAVMPGKSLGLAVIVLTILIRLLLFPISKRAIRSQYALRALEPKVQAIKAKKLDKQEESRALFQLYKEEKVNPFSGCLLLLIQLPILIALYYVFINGINRPELLYSFISPEGIQPTLFGLSITAPSIVLAIFAALTQAVQAFLTPKPPKPAESDKINFQSQLASSMSIQTRYVLPIIIFFIARNLAAAVSLYWVVSNLFSIGQEIYFRRLFKHKALIKQS
ncbi:MAG TPA: YidC/Oxa1 family membrane protein insertase [Candidatus Paceibacterota bacterium]|nr:YidC/Oxa1 family membrane protein insertase [Candidatus Paceibacterota bacterium]